MSDPPNNLSLWDALQRTDPRATKQFTRSGGFKGTQIDPTWRLKRMTEQFGPIGKGWGYEQLEWTVQDRMIFTCVRVWYRDPETGEPLYTGPQWGGTEMVRRRRDGTEDPSDECFKMSITDALGKCFVQLGLAADVFLGLFDDSKYREESDAYFQAKQNPEVQPAAIETFEALVKEKMAQPDLTLEALDDLWRGGMGQRVREIGVVDKEAQRRLTAAFSEKKAEILKRDQDPPTTGGGGSKIKPQAVAPPHDRDGVVLPHHVDVPTKDDRPDWIGWGGQLIAGVKTATTEAEIAGWVEHNSGTLEVAATKAAKAHKSVVGAIAAQRQKVSQGNLDRVMSERDARDVIPTPKGGTVHHLRTDG